MMKQSDNVNTEQWQAICCQDEKLIIVSGPGTGKTHTLVHRMKYLSQKRACEGKVLVITFTNKAAMELSERMAEFNILGTNFFAGTFHQFCLNILRQYQIHTTLPKDFSVAQDNERWEAVQKIWPEMARKEQGSLLHAISKAKSKNTGEPFQGDVYQYNQGLREMRMLDYDDLIIEAVKLLKENASILQEVKSEYSHVLVDEFQDINDAQYALLKLFLQEHIGFTAIGDPNQSIYGFRGSHPDIFERFLNDFPRVSHLSLDKNYRSAQSLLSASGQVMRGSESVSSFTDLTAEIFIDGSLTVHESRTENAEAEFVVHTIERLVGGTSHFSQDSGRTSSDMESELSFGDIAVLYRLQAMAAPLEKAFARSGIPFHIAEPKKTSQDLEICPMRGNDVQLTGEKVSCMSMHAAKGLEFAAVFVMGCEDHLLPLNLPGLLGDPEEERRLFYVAMTRAKERLYLTYSRSRFMFGQKMQNGLSPFVENIQEDLRVFEKERGQKKKRCEEQLSLFG